MIKINYFLPQRKKIIADDPARNFFLWGHNWTPVNFCDEEEQKTGGKAWVKS